jgi:predicted aspartyl protease
MMTVRERRIVKFPDDMGIFLTTVGIQSPLRRGEIRYIENALVDTGSEFTWMPAAILEELGVTRERVEYFVMADGTPIARNCGFAIVHADRRSTSDNVVFGLPGDTAILGARSIEGLNFRVDLMNKRFVHAGPRPVAALP